MNVICIQFKPLMDILSAVLPFKTLLQIAPILSLTFKALFILCLSPISELYKLF